MTLYVLKYNNYFNRKVLIEESLSSYLSSTYYAGLHVDNVSFNPNDDIRTTQILNFEPVGDYVVCTIKTTANNVTTETIHSRWFIIESKREKTGQYTVTLKRDVLVDSYDAFMSAPAYIEKGKVKEDSPYIFNKERISLNQIKQSETLLTDATKCAWIVGYVPRDAFSTPTEISVNIAISPSGSPDVTVAGINNWQYYNHTNLSANQVPAWHLNTSNSKFWILSRTKGNYMYGIKAKFNLYGTVEGVDRYPVNLDEPWDWYFDVWNEYYRPDTPFYYYYGSANHPAEDIASTCYNLLTSSDWDNISTFMSTEISNITELQRQELLALDNKIIYDSNTGIYYKITVDYNSNPVAYVNPDTAPNLFNLFKNKFDGLSIWASGYDDGRYSTACNNSFKIESNEITNGITLTLSQFEPGQATVTLDSSRGNLTDAPYDMFFMPYGDNIKVYDGSSTYIVDKNSSLAVANAIGIALGDKLYDVQLLPYCPLGLRSSKSGDYTVIDMSSVGYRDFVTISSEKINLVSWATASNFTKVIDFEISVDDVKIEGQTELYRICSPNYSNAFDFNAAMNGGLDKIFVDCTYKPFDPYIHVYPKFKGLYGDDFKDQRGLTCGGDFSITQLTNEWANYQLNNKSFLSVFDNRVSNLTKDGATYEEAVSTTISKLADQELQYKLGNIFAMPTGISKTSAMTYNNKLFPFVEHYSCTEEEKQALRDKIEYEGMTIGKIDTIQNMLHDMTGLIFVKGKIIRLSIEGKDTHYLDEIYKEVSKGVYIEIRDEEENIADE